MATSGYADAWATSWDTLRFSWWQIEQSISGNYTKIGWNIQLISTSSGAINSTTSKSWNATINGTYYEGTTTVGIGNNTSKVLASGETIMYHNSDGTKQFSYSFNQYFGITFSGSKINTVSGSGNGVLESIPRQAVLTSAPDFTDEQNPTIHFSNPAGSAVTLSACISFTGAKDDISYRPVEVDKSSYTFKLTDDEKNILYANTTGKQYRYVTFFLRTTIGDNTYWSTLQRTFTVVNCAPVLNPTVKDTGDGSFLLTDDRNKLIRYFNYPIATFNATPTKGATIVSRTVKCGSQVKTAEGNYAQFNNVDSNVFTFSVTDNRGITVTKNVTTDFIEYVNLSCVNNINKDLQSDNTVNITLNLSGDYYNGSFGAVSNNLALEYRYKTNSTPYPTDDDGNDVWTTVPTDVITIADGKYTAAVTLNFDDYTSVYTFQARAKDAIYTWGANAKEETVKIVPVFDWGEDDFNFNVDVSMQKNLGVLGHGYIKNNLSVYGDMYLGGTKDDGGSKISDFIVETGTEGIWTYCKWASGRAECWGNAYISTRFTLQWGYGYISTNPNNTAASTYIEQALPANLFVAATDAHVNTFSGGYLTTPMGRYFDASTVTTYLWVPTGPYDSISMHITYNIKGRWK